MQIEITTDHNIDAGENLMHAVKTDVEATLARFRDRLTRVEVHLGVEKATKSGLADKRCAIEARPAGQEPVGVTHHAAMLNAAWSGALDQFATLLDRRFGELDHRNGGSAIRRGGGAMGRKLGAWVSEHLAFAVTTVLFVMFALKLYVVGHGDVTTARALIAHADLAQAGVGVLVQSFRSLVSTLAFTLILARAIFPDQREWIRLAGVVVGVLAVFVVPWPIVVYVLVVALVCRVAVPRWVSDEKSPLRQNSVFRGLFLVVGAVLVLSPFAASADAPWIPAQEFHLANGAVVVGTCSMSKTTTRTC